MATAGAVIIGDEILSGKVADTNTPLLIAELAAAGVSLQRIVIVADDPADIAVAIRDCSESYDHVFCSGGLGPTHDDRTIEGIALAFNLPVVRDPTLVKMIEEFLGDRMNEAALKMADVVEGTMLLQSGSYPVLSLQNIFILPGVPQIFASKVRWLRSRIEAGPPPVLHRIFVRGFESSIAAILTQVDGELPEVKIGSYPSFDAQHNIMVTVESARAAIVEQATARLLELLPAEIVVRVESEADEHPGD